MAGETGCTTFEINNEENDNQQAFEEQYDAFKLFDDLSGPTVSRSELDDEMASMLDLCGSTASRSKIFSAELNPIDLWATLYFCELYEPEGSRTMAGINNCACKRERSLGITELH